MPHQFRHEDFFDDARMPVVVHRRVSQRPSRLHSHAFSELVIVLSGQGVHFTVDDEHDVMAGDVFVIQGSGEHGYRNPRQLELVNIMFKPGQLDLPLHDLRSLPGYHALFTLEPRFRKQHRFSSRLHLDSHQLSYLAPMIDALERECTERPPGFLAMSVVSFMQIVGYLSRCYGQVQTAASRPLLRIGEALGHLEDHYAEPIDMPVWPGSRTCPRAACTALSSAV
ncbi:MAG: cupin domain-containing protein [Lentisphaerae bacterium]|nr:cupin domain-containing protein [Lentisphaerota bacterium]